MASLPCGYRLWLVTAVGALLVTLLCFQSANTAVASRRSLGHWKTSIRSTLATLPASQDGLEIDSAAEKRKQQPKATEAEVQELLSQVSRDLEPWKASGISYEMVEAAYCRHDVIESMRIQIVNGSVYVVGQTGSYQSRARTMQLQLMQLRGKFRLPDVDFVLTTSDKCKSESWSGDAKPEKCRRMAPLFANDKAPHDNQCVSVPDFAFGGWPEAFLPPWDVASTLIGAAADRLPWKERKDVVFWRGGDTNQERKVVHESRLVQDSGKADVRLMSWGNGWDAFKRDFVSLADHCKYKYLLHLSGIAYSSRLKFLMLCGSAVIFPHRGSWEHVEFWHHMLQNQENVLLTESMSWENQGAPLLKAVDELRGNDTWARDLGQAAQHLAAVVLHPDNVERYYLELLTQYSALQTFKVTLHPDAVPLDAALLRPENHVEVHQRSCNVCNGDGKPSVAHKHA